MRVLVIAENMLVRMGLAAVLRDDPAVEIVGQVATGGDLSADLDVYRPDAVVIDAGDPAPEMVEALAGVELPLVVLLAEPDAALPLMALAHQSAGEGIGFALLLRDSDPAALQGAVRAAFASLIVIDPVLVPLVLADAPGNDEPPPLDDLTPRELEVLRLLAQGLTNKSIGQRLGISPNTVKFHLNAVLSKLDAQSRTEAVVRATRLGLIVL